MIITRTKHDLIRAKLLLDNFRILSIGYSASVRKDSIIIKFVYYPKIKYDVFIFGLVAVADICGLDYIILSSKPRLEESVILFIFTTNPNIRHEFLSWFDVDIHELPYEKYFKQLKEILKKTRITFSMSQLNHNFRITLISELTIIYPIALFIYGLGVVNSYNMTIQQKIIGKKKIFALTGFTKSSQ